MFFNFLLTLTKFPGSGRFLMWLAKRNPDSQNYLGLEIRQKVQNTLLGLLATLLRILLIELIL